MIQNQVRGFEQLKFTDVQMFHGYYLQMFLLCKVILVTIYQDYGCTVKTFGLLQTLFQLPQLHVCGVGIMRLKDCFQSSEDLEIKTLRSFFLINWSSFQKTNQLPFLEKAWLHSYRRNTSNAHVAKIGLLKDKIMKKLLDGIQKKNILEAFLGLPIMIPLWCN